MDHKDRDKAWRLATCGGDNNVRVSACLSLALSHARPSRELTRRVRGGETALDLGA